MEHPMTRTDTVSTKRRSTWRIGLASGAVLIAVAVAGWHWRTTQAIAQDTTLAPAAATVQPVSYPAPGKEPKATTEFPDGAAPISGPEIVAALSDHTAVLPGGFVEYYAPDGNIHGLAEQKHYGGHWEVRNGDFCTLLQDSSDSVCSPVERKGNLLYWSTDGDKEASPVQTMPGNPQNIQ
jgi:hypothetical protein